MELGPIERVDGYWMARPMRGNELLNVSIWRKGGAREEFTARAKEYLSAMGASLPYGGGILLVRDDE